MIGPSGFMASPKLEKRIKVVRNVVKGKIQYRLTFDEDGILDTVHKYRASSVVEMNGGQKEIKFFVRHQHDFYARNSVKNCDYI